MNWTVARVAGFAADAGFRGDALVEAVAVAWATSGGNDQWSYRQDPGPQTDQRGLWGIDVVKYPRDAALDLLRPQVAAQAAFTEYVMADGSWEWSATWRAGITPDVWAVARSAAEHPSRVQSATNPRSQLGSGTLDASMARIADAAQYGYPQLLNPGG